MTAKAYNKCVGAAYAAGVAVLALASTPLAAQRDTTSTAEERGGLEQVLACSSLTDATERLTCFDTETAALKTKLDSKELRVITRDDVRKTRRSLFGFAMPKINLFGSEDNPEGDRIEKLQTTITGISRQGRNNWLIKIAEGSLWRIENPPMRFMPPRMGEKIEIEQGALSAYWLRIGSQTGVKGSRVE